MLLAAGKEGMVAFECSSARVSRQAADAPAWVAGRGGTYRSFSGRMRVVSMISSNELS